MDLAIRRGGERWREEVLLQTGEKIIVDREFRRGASGDISNPSGPIAYAKIDFSFRGSNYRWEGAGILPMLLQIDSDNSPVVISTIPYCHSWWSRGEPPSMYVAEKYTSGKWREVSLGKISVVLDGNLSADSDGKKYLTTSDRKLMDRSDVAEHSKRVLVSEKTNCPSLKKSGV